MTAAHLLYVVTAYVLAFVSASAAGGHGNTPSTRQPSDAAVRFFVTPTHTAAAAAAAEDGDHGGATFGSIGEAVAAIRALPATQRAKGVVVTIAGGDYAGKNNLLSLGPEVSGMPDTPIVFEADAGDPSPVRLHGGVDIPPQAFKRAGNAPNGLAIWRADLKGLGLTRLVSSFNTGWTCANGNRTELFFGGQPMTLARHPNKDASGVWQYFRVGTVGSDGFGAGTDDTASGKPVPSDPVWANESKSLWVHGFWSQDWRDSFEKVGSVVSNSSGVFYKIIGAALQPVSGARYVLLNGKSLLDAPSEYYVDAEAQQLFFIPPAGKADPRTVPAVLSQRTTAHVVNQSSHMILRGLRFEYGIGAALQLINVTDVRVQNCTMSNSGTHGVELSGYNSSVSDSEIAAVGCTGVSLFGGNAMTLAPGLLAVDRNNIHDFARVSRTLRVGVAWRGCGNFVRQNEIHHAPHSGIMIDVPSGGASDGVGVNTEFSGNYLHDLCQGTADGGAFYVGLSWANRGNVIRGNRIERIFQTEKMAQHTSLNGVYLDDMESGWLIRDNEFIDTQDCMFIGGGRQNIVVNNTFRNCSVPVHLDDRGLGWMDCLGRNWSTKFIAELSNVYHYREPPWSHFFPDINTSYLPCAPVLNTVIDNRYCVPPPLPPPPGCVSCPSSHPYQYGGPVGGWFCCTVAVNVSTGLGNCMSKSLCCLEPGSNKITPYGKHGCQGAAHCSSYTPNRTACPLPPASGHGVGARFTDAPSNVSWLNVFARNIEFSCTK